MKLSTTGKVVVAILAASYIGAFSALLLGAFSVGKIVAFPLSSNHPSVRLKGGGRSGGV